MTGPLRETGIGLTDRYPDCSMPLRADARSALQHNLGRQTHALSAKMACLRPRHAGASAPSGVATHGRCASELDLRCAPSGSLRAYGLPARACCAGCPPCGRSARHSVATLHRPRPGSLKLSLSRARCALSPSLVAARARQPACPLRHPCGAARGARRDAARRWRVDTASRRRARRSPR